MKVSVPLIAMLTVLPVTCWAAGRKETSHRLDRGFLPEAAPAGGNPGPQAEGLALPLAEIARRLPSAEPAAPNGSPGLDVAENNRIWQGCPSMAIRPKGRLWISFLSGGRWEYDYRCGQTRCG